MSDRRTSRSSCGASCLRCTTRMRMPQPDEIDTAEDASYADVRPLKRRALGTAIASPAARRLSRGRPFPVVSLVEEATRQPDRADRPSTVGAQPGLGSPGMAGEVFSSTASSVFKLKVRSDPETARCPAGVATGSSRSRISRQSETCRKAIRDRPCEPRPYLADTSAQ